MTVYDIEFEYKIKEFSDLRMPADNPEQAEEFAVEYIKETYDDVTDVVITSVRELKDDATLVVA